MTESGKLNVLFLPSRYPTEQLPINGQFVRDHAEAVALKHNIVLLYLAGLAGPYHDYREAGVRIIKHGIRFSGMGVGLARYIRDGMRDFARLHREFKPDIIHVHVAYPAGILAMLISRRYGIPMVLTEIPETVKVFKAGTVKNFLAKRLISAMKVICPVSRSTQNLLEDYSKGPFVIVPIMIDSNLFHYVAQPQRGENEPKRILAVSTLADYKGIGYLLHGLAELGKQRRDFTLDLIGDGSQRSEYEALVEQSGLGDRVNFLGTRAKASVAEMLQQCDFLVVPNLYDIDSPIAVAALACGKPVVSSRWVGAEELINDRVGIVVERASAEALREGINQMLDHYQDYDPQTIVAYARSRYGREGIAEQFDAVYHHTLSGRKRRKLWGSELSSTWAAAADSSRARSA
jgi:L-malate glycosyltransferase